MCEEERTSLISKPHHVRKLQFAQVILKLNSVYDIESGQDKNGRLIIDDGSSRIPCMSKFEFVEKWIETHDNYPVDPVDPVDPVEQAFLVADDSKFVSDSTISQIDNSLQSPIVGKLKKRRAKAVSLSTSISSGKNLFSETKNHLSDQSHSEYTELMAGEYVDGNENVDESFSGSDQLPLQPKDINVQNSPILGKEQNRRYYKRFSCQQCKKPRCDYLKSDSSEIRVQSERDALEVSIEEPPLKKTKESNQNYDDSDRAYACNKIISDSRKSSNMKKATRAECPNDENVIEEASSTDTKSNRHGTRTPSSMIIEDSDTEDQKFHVDTLRPITSNIVENGDLDATYFSNADTLRSRASLYLFSQNISSATPATNQQSESIAISNEASPTRTPSDLRILLQVIDSGRKRKKPKRGSLVERLQVLINREKSSVRIWRHCLKHPVRKNVNNPYVAIRVQSCRLCFDKQLLEGIVVEDFASLLPPLDVEANHEKRQTHPRNISVLLTPELAGKMKITSDSMAQIAPPWILLDRKDLLLALSCVSIASSRSITPPKMNSAKVLPDGERMLEKFHCWCNLDGERFDHCTLCWQCALRANEPNVPATLTTNK